MGWGCAPEMRFLKLRIAWSVGWLIACVLLCVLWVRSYWKSDSLVGNRGANWVSIYHLIGEIHYSVLMPAAGISLPIASWHTDHRDINEENLQPNEQFRQTCHRLLGVRWQVFGNGYHFALSYWLAILLVGAIATLPWVHWKFSLRSLLIATTLVALVLGLIVWLHKE
jgi:hypothetical protein